MDRRTIAVDDKARNRTSNKTKTVTNHADVK